MEDNNVSHIANESYLQETLIGNSQIYRHDGERASSPLSQLDATNITQNNNNTNNNNNNNNNIANEEPLSSVSNINTIYKMHFVPPSESEPFNLAEQEHARQSTLHTHSQSMSLHLHEPHNNQVEPSPLITQQISLGKSFNSSVKSGPAAYVVRHPAHLASSLTTLRGTRLSGFSRVASQRDCALEVLNMDRFSSFYLPDVEMMCNMQPHESSQLHSSSRHLYELSHTRANCDNKTTNTNSNRNINNITDHKMENAEHNEPINADEKDNCNYDKSSNKCKMHPIASTHTFATPYRKLHLGVTYKEQTESNNVTKVNKEDESTMQNTLVKHNNNNNNNNEEIYYGNTEMQWKEKEKEYTSQELSPPLPQSISSSSYSSHKLFNNDNNNNISSNNNCNCNCSDNSNVVHTIVNNNYECFREGSNIEEEQQQQQQREEHLHECNSISCNHLFNAEDYQRRLRRPHGPLLKRTFTQAKRKLGVWLGKAEEVFVEQPAHIIGKWETHLFDALYKPFQSISYLPFFNLETAIDCTNLAWETYMNVEPETATLHRQMSTIAKVYTKMGENKMCVKEDKSVIIHPHTNYINSCNCYQEQQQQQQQEEEREEEIYKQEEEYYCKHQHDRLEQEEHQQKELRVVNEKIGNSQESTDANATVNKISHLPNVEHEFREQEHQEEQRQPFQQTNNTTQNVETTFLPSPLSSRVPHKAEQKERKIDVEQYGYTLLYTAMEKEVQVIICSMNVDANEHHGKAPRLVIAFRGTVTARNARYDLRLHRRVWREMYDAEWQSNNNYCSINNNNDNNGSICTTLMKPEIKSKGKSSTNNFRNDVFEQDNNTALETQTRYWWKANTEFTSLTSRKQASGGVHGLINAFHSHTRFHPTVHTGFLKIWLALQPRVMRQITHFLATHRDIVFRVFTTGHSMGGALACLAAYSITNLLKRIEYPIPDVTVYTFGQPRMGNLTFKRMYNKTVPRSFRVVNENDIVGTITILGGYHVGIEVAIDRHGNFIVKPTDIETFFRPTKAHGLALAQHRLSNYCASLNAIAENTSCKARCLQPYVSLSDERFDRQLEQNDNHGCNCNCNADNNTASNIVANNGSKNYSYSKCLSHSPTRSLHSFTIAPHEQVSSSSLMSVEPSSALIVNEDVNDCA